MRNSLFKLQLKVYLTLTLVYIVVALTGWLVLWALTPHRYFGVFPSIDFLYWICGMLLNYFLNRSLRQDQEKMLNVYMLFRFGQFILTLVFLIIGLKVIGYPKAPFALSLLANYFIYTALEVVIYYRYHKKAMTGKWN